MMKIGIDARGDMGFVWSDQLHNVDIELFTVCTGPKLGDGHLLYIQSLLFITDIKITTIQASQTDKNTTKG